MSVMSGLETIFCLVDRAVDAALLSSHWELLRCVHNRVLDVSTASAFLQD